MSPAAPAKEQGDADKGRAGQSVHSYVRLPSFSGQCPAVSQEGRLHYGARRHLGGCGSPAGHQRGAHHGHTGKKQKRFLILNVTHPSLQVRLSWTQVNIHNISHQIYHMRYSPVSATYFLTNNLWLSTDAGCRDTNTICYSWFNLQQTTGWLSKPVSKSRSPNSKECYTAICLQKWNQFGIFCQHWGALYSSCNTSRLSMYSCWMFGF